MKPFLTSSPLQISSIRLRFEVLPRKWESMKQKSTGNHQNWRSPRRTISSASQNSCNQLPATHPHPLRYPDSLGPALALHLSRGALCPLLSIPSSAASPLSSHLPISPLNSPFFPSDAPTSPQPPPFPLSCPSPSLRCPGAPLSAQLPSFLLALGPPSQHPPEARQQRVERAEVLPPWLVCPQLPSFPLALGPPSNSDCPRLSSSG